MLIPANQGEGGTNDWKRNFSDTGNGITNPAKKFRGVGKGDLGSTFYIQWRQRFSLAHLNNYYRVSSGRGGWKMINIGDGDDYDEKPKNSALINEIVMNNDELRLCPSMYHSVLAFAQIADKLDTSSIKQYKDSNGELHNGYTFDERFQNAIDKGPTKINLFERYAMIGAFRIFKPPYGQSKPYRYINRPVPPEYPAVCFHPDEWMTFQVGVTLGPLGSSPSSIEGSDNVEGWTNSRVEVWAAREGQSSVKIIDKGGITLRREAGADLNDSEGYGKIWFTTFHTGLIADPAERDDAETWYDELIISKSRIPDPKNRFEK